MAPPTRTPRERWISAGLTALASGGPDAVRIDPLAKSLGVTRGGFYWHFEDRQALLDAMLEEWERSALSAVIERVEAAGGDDRTKLRRLFGIATSGREILTTDLAVRDWARRDEAVAARLRRVDNARMDYMRPLFAAITTDPAEVEVRCTLAMTLWIGNYFLAADHGEHTRAEVLELALEHLEAS